MSYSSINSDMLVLWKFQIFCKNFKIHINISHGTKRNRIAPFVRKDNCKDEVKKHQELDHVILIFFQCSSHLMFF